MDHVPSTEYFSHGLSTLKHGIHNMWLINVGNKLMLNIFEFLRDYPKFKSIFTNFKNTPFILMVTIHNSSNAFISFASIIRGFINDLCRPTL